LVLFLTARRSIKPQRAVQCRRKVDMPATQA
jgi:hypothetical protein